MNEKLEGPQDFKTSNGWLRNFKSRHGIRELGVQGEKLLNDVPAAEAFKTNFLTFLEEEGCCMEDLYNADESGLYWKALPRKSLASRRENTAPGYKVSEERVTILTCANVAGNHALPILMIGKAKKPRCFKNVMCLPVCYKSQKSAWMDSAVFLDWFKHEFIPKVRKFREEQGKTGKVILLLDNASSHPDIAVLNSIDENFIVKYLPPNVTALIQPMDQGVIEKVKRLYRKEMSSSFVT